MAKKPKTPQEMTLPEIDTRIAELAQEHDELMETRGQLLIAHRKEMVAEVRALIAAAGYEPEEIVPLLTTARRARRGRGAAPRATGYPCYVDPANPEHVYSRGVLPGWMKEQMLALGLDPKAKADREAFKSSHLRAEVAA